MRNSIVTKVARCILSAAWLFGFSMAQATIEYPDFDDTIENIIIDCKGILPTQKHSNTRVKIQPSASFQLCLTKAMVVEMRKTPQFRELILESALQANPEYILALIEAAIKAGMAPLVTLMRAIEIYPEYGEAIRKGAMNAGVDPFVVTEATSGLEN